MEPTIQILIGDVRAKLREMADESAQCVVTSPPYWGLRDYGTAPQIWGGKPDCAHVWGDHGSTRQHFDRSTGGKDANGAGKFIDERGVQGSKVARGQSLHLGATCATCATCAAWRGELGLEPTPDLFVEHIVEVFREVKRVLRKEGTLWLNMGDCYANDNKWGGSSGGKSYTSKEGGFGNNGRLRRNTGLKQKDLVGQPWRVAFALQADGWYLRQDIIWAKPNPMPESIRDRCTKAHEYLFLLSKSPRYYFNAQAIKEPVTGGSHARGAGVNPKARRVVFPQGWASGPGSHTAIDHNRITAQPRPKQNASFSASVAQLVDSRNKRSVWVIPTEPYPEAHYATFPSALVRPCILAGTKPGDVVLDPFGGSGTTAAVANGLGRSSVLIDLNPDNERLMRARVSRGLRNPKAKRLRPCDTRELFDVQQFDRPMVEKGAA